MSEMKNELTDELKTKFKDEVDQASWDMLESHHKRGALFLIKDLELVDAAVALATDDAASVKAWLESGKLAKVEDEMTAPWAEKAFEKNFDFVIVQPYVLIKTIK